MTIRRLAGAATVLALAGAGLALGATPAQAQTDSETLTVEVAPGDDCGTAVVTFINPNDFAFWGDHRIKGEEGTPDADVGAPVPSVTDPGYPGDLEDAHDHMVTPDQELTQPPWDGSGETFGLQYNPVLIPAGDTRVVEVDVDEATEVQARIWRGPNQSVYVPWTDPVEIEACPEPTPTPTADPSPTPEPTPTETDPPAGGTGGSDDDKGSLPQTGASLPVLTAGGAGLLGLGGGLAGLAWWSKRRQRAELLGGTAE